MPTYERSVRVAAPFEEAWAFHTRISGLLAVTPDWLHLRVEGVRGPDGEDLVRGPDGASRVRDTDGDDESGAEGATDPDVLEAGTVVRLSVRPGGVGPRRGWTSRIVARERSDGEASLRDVMVDGPFPQWEHTHLCYRDGDGMIVRDVVRYRLPGGAVGRRLGPLAVLGFEPAFRYRHRKTRELLEGARPAHTP